MVIIASAGKIGSGKSETQKQIVIMADQGDLPSEWSKAEAKAFAEGIKHLVAIAVGTTVEAQYEEGTKNARMYYMGDYEKWKDIRPVQIVATLTGRDYNELKRGDLDGETDPIYRKTYKELVDHMKDYYKKNLIDGGFSPQMTCGEFQQHVGMHFRDVYGNDIWARIGVKGYDPTKHIWVFTDLRFFEEIEEVLKLGGFLLRLEGDPKGVRARSKRDPNHPSETTLDNYRDWHAMIDNSEDNIEKFRLNLKTFIQIYGIYPRRDFEDSKLNPRPQNCFMLGFPILHSVEYDQMGKKETREVKHIFVNIYAASPKEGLGERRFPKSSYPQISGLNDFEWSDNPSAKGLHTGQYTFQARSPIYNPRYATFEEYEKEYPRGGIPAPNNQDDSEPPSKRQAKPKKACILPPPEAWGADKMDQ